MDDLISKASVCEILADIYPTDGEKVVAVKEIDKAYETIINLPYAERRGRWTPDFGGMFKGGAYWFRCSRCGRIVPNVRNGGWNYCPYCGAKMDGDEE